MVKTKIKMQGREGGVGTILLFLSPTLFVYLGDVTPPAATAAGSLCSYWSATRGLHSTQRGGTCVCICVSLDGVVAAAGWMDERDCRGVKQQSRAELNLV